METPQNDLENFPNFEEIPRSPNFITLIKRISTIKKIRRPIEYKGYVVEGFEDVLAGDTLGEGLFTNTADTVSQLCYALILSDHPFLRAIPPELTPRQIIEKLREFKVLSGMRIIDLGSGPWPAFAMVAGAVGATVWSVDTERLYSTMRSERHIIQDLCEEDAAKKILQKTGGNFDLVTECIIDLIPSNSTKPEKPKPDMLLKTSHSLLKSGGHFFLTDPPYSQRAFKKR